MGITNTTVSPGRTAFVLVVTKVVFLMEKFLFLRFSHRLICGICSIIFLLLMLYNLELVAELNKVDDGISQGNLSGGMAYS